MDQEERERRLIYLVLIVIYAYECATMNSSQEAETIKDGVRHTNGNKSVSKDVVSIASETKKVNLTSILKSGNLSAKDEDRQTSLRLISDLTDSTDKTNNIYSVKDSENSDRVGNLVDNGNSKVHRPLGEKDFLAKNTRIILHPTREINAKNIDYFENDKTSENRVHRQEKKIKIFSNRILKRERNFDTEIFDKLNINQLRNQKDFSQRKFQNVTNLKHEVPMFERIERSYRTEFHTPHEFEHAREQSSLPICRVQLFERSKTIFHSQLISREPNFIQFSLSFCEESSIRPTFTDDVFMGKRWFWTYNTSSGPYPFLSWNLDYGILSFHLLEAKTINVPRVCLRIYRPNPYQNCEFTFGKSDTSKALTNALIPLINISERGDVIKYPESYFCYLATRQESRKTLHYWASVYLYYPINFVHYKCCSVTMNYTNSSYMTKCQDGDKGSSGGQTWSVTTKLPYFSGVLFLMYFPIMLFEMTAWLSKDENILEDLTNFEMTEDFESQETIDNNWIFSDGCSPFTLGDILSFKTIGLSNKHPVLVSRLRRLLFVVLFPIFIYIQLAMYAEGMGQWSKEKIQVRDLVRVGAPMGFLAILGDEKDRRKVFVPFLGGPLGIVILYYTLSLLFIALPRSVKQVVETGLPTSNLSVRSPLFFGSRKIIEMSKINVKHYDMKPGYTKAATLMKCRFYMLSTKEFWKQLWNIQVERIRVTDPRYCLLLCFFLPFYVVFCSVEILLCMLYHGLPFCTFVSGMINGALKSLRYLKGQSLILNSIFKYRITCFIGVSVMFLLYMVYIYVIFLVFIISLGFIFNVITHCFVAIIIYPSVSFGYLFFFTVLFYYFINLIRDFGYGYMELLSKTVDISRHLALDEFRITLIDRHLSVTNAYIENIVDVQINNIPLQISSDILRSMQRTRTNVVMIKERDSAFGIPKRLFEHVVARHRPIHQQVINLCFKAVIMITFVILTLSISAAYVGGPTTEISEVMHVIFIVAVGALPELVQAILSRSDNVLKHEIEEREIEKSITEFWNQETTRSNYHSNYGSI